MNTAQSNQSKSGQKFLEYSHTVGMTSMDGRGFYYPVDTALGKNRKLYVVSRTLESNIFVRVTMCDLDSEFFGNFGSWGEGDGQFIWPSCGAVDSQGRVYISDEQIHRISVFDDSGSFLSKWGTPGAGEGELDTPSDLAFDSHDNLYVSDTYNNRIQKFTTDGRFLLEFGTELSLPWGLTVDAKNEVYVADWGNDCVQKYSAEGAHLALY